MVSTAPRFSESDLVSLIARVDARLERLEHRLDPLLGVAEEVPQLLATATDVADDLATTHQADARLRAAVAVLERVSRPETLKRLETAVDHLESLPALVATVVDIVDAQLENVDTQTTTRSLKALINMLSDPSVAAQLERAPQTFDLVGRIERTFLEAQATPPGETLGLFGLLRVLKEPAVQRSLHAAIAVARDLGNTQKQLT